MNTQGQSSFAPPHDTSKPRIFAASRGGAIGGSRGNLLASGSSVGATSSAGTASASSSTSPPSSSPLVASSSSSTGMSSSAGSVPVSVVTSPQPPKRSGKRDSWNALNDPRGPAPRDVASDRHTVIGKDYLAQLGLQQELEAVPASDSGRSFSINPIGLNNLAAVLKGEEPRDTTPNPRFRNETVAAVRPLELEVERRINELKAQRLDGSSSSSSSSSGSTSTSSTGSDRKPQHLELSLDNLALVDLPMQMVLNILEQGVCAKLTTLHLNCNQIVALPSAIGQLQFLEELNVESNLLTTLPKEIGSLKLLNRIHAFDNKIAKLPETIGCCTNLSRLFLGKNRLAKLPSEIGNLKQLRWLDVSDNLLSSFPPEIQGLRQLGWLCADSNRFTRVPVEICSLSALCSLSLLDNPIVAVDPFSLELLNMPKLTDLRISTKIAFPSVLLARRDPDEIIKFLVFAVERWGLDLDDKSHWEPDDERPKCTKCSVPFTFTKRRHHCRVCGLIFCGKDCSKNLDVPVLGEERVCDPCYDALDPSHPSNQYKRRWAKKAEEEASKTYGLSIAEEHLPLEHKRKILESQMAALQESINSLHKSQDALQKMLEIYARDLDARSDAEYQVEEASRKLEDLEFKKNRVKLLLETLEEEETINEA